MSLRDAIAHELFECSENPYSWDEAVEGERVWRNDEADAVIALLRTELAAHSESADEIVPELLAIVRDLAAKAARSFTAWTGSLDLCRFCAAPKDHDARCPWLRARNLLAPDQENR